MKKKYKSVDEARWLGKECAGFLNDQHVVTVHPEQRKMQALGATLYDEIGPKLEVRTVSFKGIDQPEKMRSALTGLGRIISRPDKKKLKVGVGIGGAFAVGLYQFSDEGRPLSVQAFSKGWPCEAEWQYRYTPDGKLDEISAGGPVPMWKRM